jgi:hypothetical protein
VNLERLGSLLLRLAGVPAVAAIAVAVAGHNSARFLALSGCLIMAALAALLLAPRPVESARRREPVAQRPEERYVPRQRTPVRVERAQPVEAAAPAQPPASRHAA